MEKSIKSDTFSVNELSALLGAIQGGDSAAEKRLYEAIALSGSILSRIARKWSKSLETEPEDLVQDCFLHILEKLRRGGLKIPNAEAWLQLISQNYLRNKWEEKGAKKRRPAKKETRGLPPEMAYMETGGSIGLLRDEMEADAALGQPSEDPSARFERRENEDIDKAVLAIMGSLPAELRSGIEKSLDLIADLFRVRSTFQDKLKRDAKHDSQPLRAIKLIEKARKIVGKMRGSDPQRRDLLRLRDLREAPGPSLSGRPEEDRKYDEWLAEIKELERKYGLALDLYEAQVALSAEVLRPYISLRLTPTRLLLEEDLAAGGIWIDYLSDIAGMKVSPLNFIDKVWSQAPEFMKPGPGKYRNRKAIELVLYSYKKTSKGTDREFLFSSIRDREFATLEELGDEFERCRKAGYGYALKKKYKPIIELIYRESFARPSR